MRWPSGWTKPVYRRRKSFDGGELRGYVSPGTPRKAGGSIKLGPVSITSTGRIYLFGARVR